MKDATRVVLAGLAVACLLFAWVGVTVARAYFEAAAYERVTGNRVSTWDAIFLDLRVEENVRQKGGD